MIAEPIKRARQLTMLLRERNPTNWDELDRELVFALSALVNYAEHIEARNKPQWVGLTDEELLAIPLTHWSINGQLAYGKTIQAKLKEKNK